MNPVDDILVIDEEPATCELLRHGFRGGNFRVSGVTRSEDAVSAAVRTRPCLIVLDLFMKRSNGLRVLKEIRAASPDVPVVLIAGHADAAGRETARRLGAAELLTKPVNWNYLRRIAHLSSMLKARGS